VHEIYQYGGSLGKFFDEKYLEIEACERSMQELKEQIGQIKGTRECPKCKKTVDRIAEFCPKCGFRLELTATEYTPPPIPQAQYHEETAAVPPPPIPEPLPVPEQFIPEVPSPIPPPPQEKKKICRICNAENEISTKFCLSCGRILD